MPTFLYITLSPILPQLKRSDMDKAFQGMGKKAPQKPPVLAPSSPVHWDVKNITGANHCFVTNHVLEIGKPLVVRIVKVHLRVSRGKKKNQSITKFLSVTLVIKKDPLKSLENFFF